MSAHGPLARTSTAPVFPTRSAGTGIMSNSARSSQLSGSTTFASSSTSLSSMNSSTTLVPPKMAQNNGNVIATNNIINQRADASRSLYQICVNLRQRLAQVPDFDVHLRNSDADDEYSMKGNTIDPVSSIWRMLRKGLPLVTIWNCLQTSEPIVLDDKLREDKIPKQAAFKFLAACLKDNGEMQLAPAVCFSLSDLFGDDTSGLVKVTQVVNLVLDVAEQKGLLIASEKADKEITTDMPDQPKMTYRDHVVKELVDTERKYVQDLENLHDLKKTIESKGVVSGDIIHDIFLNINAILDFQRRFLIQIETTNSRPAHQQKWGAAFANFEEAFKIYQPFIANQAKAATIAKREYEKIALADHPVASDYNTLDGFLLKPMQRLVKYPLLLKDLRDKGNKENTDEEIRDDLTAGMEAANRALMGANSAVDLEMRQDALADLRERVDDWKNHRVDHFGELLLYGHFPVVTGKSDVQKEVRNFFTRNRNDSSQSVAIPTTRSLRNSLEVKCKALLRNSTPELGTQWDVGSALQYHEFFSDQRHNTEPTLDTFSNGTRNYQKNYANISGLSRPSDEQYTIYLFERILLCCKDLNPSKSKDKLLGGQKDKKDKKEKIRKEPNKNAKLQLKGRIFMTNVTDVASLAKLGSYTVQIFWKGDPGVENFIIRFSNEELMRKWYEGVDAQRKLHSQAQATGSSPDATPANFTWMQEQGAPMLNPYAQQEDDEEEEDYATSQSMVAQAIMPNSTYPGPASSMPRNSSSVSLRSRSTTGSSQDSLATVVRSQPPRFPMPMPPLSLQTLMTPGMPSPSQRGGDSYFSPVAESPASSRASTSNGMYPFPRQTTPNGGWEETTRYDQNRNTAPAGPRAPSRGSQSTIDGYQMTGRAAQRPSLPAQPSSQRSRSHSTPDVNAPGARRLPNGSLSGQPVPAVPGIPAHLAYDSGIPRSANNSPNGVPVRTSTQSPGLQRERQGSLAPTYSRNNTTQLPTMSSFDSRTMSPLPSENGITLPTQLKVKVTCDGNYVTLVVAFNITYQSLVDRIDAKVGRFSTSTIAQGTLRLKYRDEDGDFVTVESDDDIQIAFQEWREAQKQQYLQGQLGEIELFCNSTEN